jgi:Mg-chelatase subunit ChlD
LVQEGAAADQAVQQAGKRTESRRDLQRKHDKLDEVSPEVGHLDEEAVERSLSEDPDETLAMLADLTGATDPKLRELARQLAGRIVVDLARRGSPRKRGIGKLQLQPLGDTGGDIDVDASIDGLMSARARGGVPDIDELKARAWSRPGTAFALVVDRSGSMGGDRLATAAVAAASVAWRAPEDHSVLAFSNQVIVPKSQDGARPPEQVVQALLTLRGHGTTDVALALRAAREQLSRSRAVRKITILLSDCRHNVPGDVMPEATATEELVIIAPADDTEAADQLAKRVGARVFPLAGASAIPGIFAELLPS